MKFLALGLEPFGSFSDLALELGEGGNLHFIMGPNEAGKSTALRAIKGFLFGIPKTSVDVHRYEGRQLRVHATIRGADGEAHTLIRRKGRKETLMHPDGTAADEALLLRWLGGIDSGVFQSMYGLTHTDLVEGGKKLLAGDSSLGETLFGAGTGAGMRSVLGTLAKDAKAIFGNTASTRPLNVAIARFKKSEKIRKDATLKPRDWKQSEKALRESEQRYAGLKKQRGELDVKKQKLDRLKLTIPDLIARATSTKALQELPETPALPPTATSERTEAENELRRLRIRHSERADERAKKVEELESLSIPESVLAQRLQIDALTEALGADKKAMSDLPKLQLLVDNGLHDIARGLRALGKNIAVENLDELRISKQAEAKLRTLAAEKGALEQELKQARKAAKQVDATLQLLESRRDALPAARDAHALRLQTRQTHKLGDPERDLTELAARIATGRRENEALFATLGRYQGSPSECCALSLPSVETIEGHRGDMERCTTDLRSAKAEEARILEKQAELTASIKTLQAKGTVPTLDQLEAVRKHRDGQWSQIRSSWIEGEVIAESSASQLAESFVSSTKEADHVSDKLRDDAERVGQLSGLEIERKQEENALSRNQKQLRELEERASTLHNEWQELWEAQGIATGTPVEMRAWLANHQKLVTSGSDLARLRHEHDALAEVIATHRRRLEELLATVQEAVAAQGESLNLLLEQCDLACQEIEEGNRKRKDWQRDWDEALRSRADAAADLPAAEEAMEQWNSAWRAALRDIGSSEESTVSEMQAELQGLGALFDTWKEIENAKRRIDHIERDHKVFADNVGSIVAAATTWSDERPAAEAAVQLANALSEGTRANEKKKSLQESIARLETELAALERERTEHESIISLLMERAGVDDAEKLIAVENASKERRDLQQKLENIENNLLRHGLPIDELEEEARDVSVDTLEHMISGAREEQQELAAVIEKEHDAVVRLRNDFEAMDASSAATQAAEDAQLALAEIRSLAGTYTKLRLAEHVLAGEIERYRQQNQGPVLERAGEMFRLMTLNQFRGLGTEFNSKDQLILVCTRASGTTVEVSALSEGTRDQLYLALRLASLELHAQRNEPLPLIMDDLLINFDDERAAATLELLAEVAKTTQILFFSHHDHLLEIARRTLPEGSWHEHRLAESGEK